MAYHEQLVQRLREAFAAKPGMTERRMFGGIAFMSAGRMIVGVLESALVARVGKAEYEASLRRPHVRKMDFTGRPMRGYVYVDPPGIRTRHQLRTWLRRCESFVETLPPRWSRPLRRPNERSGHA